MNHINTQSQAQTKPYIFVLGNEKGGVGKTTCSMHLIIGLIYRGFKVASIDVDSRQHSLTSYINNRIAYNNSNTDQSVEVPLHYHIADVKEADTNIKHKKEKEVFTEYLSEIISQDVDYVIIDTPGSYTNLSKYAHSYADTVITPVNDSFIDLDVMAKIEKDTFESSSPSIYSQMLWEQKMERASRDRGVINWVVVRNRLSAVDAKNKRNIELTLQKLSKRIAFKVLPGFGERVIFRELFPYGLTLLDVKKTDVIKSFSLSHVAARHEIRSFIDVLLELDPRRPKST